MKTFSLCIKKLGLLSGVLSIILLPALYAAPAHAQLYHSWVSNNGSDAAACTEAAPCQTFAHALFETEAGGEVSCINSGSYIAGAGLMITKSITIDCNGTLAWGNGDTDTFVGDAITINGSGIVVHLRNLSISGLSLTTAEGSANQNGVTVGAAALVNIEDCFINNFGANGINVTTSANTVLKVRNTSIAGTSNGIYLAPTGGAVKGTVDHTSIVNVSSNGIAANGTSGGTIKATISDSVVSDNENGIVAVSSGSGVVLVIDQTKVANNAAAGLLAAGSGAGIVARNTTVFDNGTGLETASGGGLISYGNNSVAGNTTNGTFTATIGTE
jgi:hypothetical protein